MQGNLRKISFDIPIREFADNITSHIEYMTDAEKEDEGLYMTKNLTDEEHMEKNSFCLV